MAGAALLIDYVLTVAVSVAAGVAARHLRRSRRSTATACWLACSASSRIAVGQPAGHPRVGQDLRPADLPLRRELPRACSAYGIVALASSAVGGAATPAACPPGAWKASALFLLLRAFASGCTALTGVEAVSDGVPAFKPPEAHNARIVLAWLGVILVTLFLGITFLGLRLRPDPRAPTRRWSPSSPARSSATASSTTRSRPSTMLILMLAANTSFADFPRLAYFLARDGSSRGSSAPGATGSSSPTAS